MHFEVHVDVNSLERSASNAIWGGIWISIEGFSFPEYGWNDMSVAVMHELLRCSLQIASKVPSTAVVRFFDGPISIEFKRSDGAQVEVKLRGGGITPDHSLVEPLDSVLEQVRSASRKLLEAVEARGWSDQADVVALKAAVARES